jgi:aminoglycoside phosphotransferase (APT) family kinase protein
LFLRNALSGSITPLASAGFRVTVLDASDERRRFAEARAAAHTPGAVRTAAAPADPRLPFPDQAFDVVVQEDGLPEGSGLFAHTLAECLRVARGEVLLTADNRLAYKRSSGRRGDFRVPGPLAYARAALWPRRGERTLRGYRRLFAGDGFERPRAFALYPHARDFTHVVALDEELPALAIGPKERRNRLKLAGHALGLFPVFTPSFALLARRNGPSAPSRLERILDALAERTGEPRPCAEEVLGTRGNTLVVQTRAPGATGRGVPGAWTLHVPLCPKNVPQLELHVRTLELVRTRFPRVPVPEPLFHGWIEGLWLSCERRLAGRTAPQITGDRARVDRMQHAAAEHLAQLVTRPARTFTAADFAEQIERRVRLVQAHAGVESTQRNLERLLDATRERLVGAQLPLVLYHGDLRSKHVQVDEQGGVLGYLDWGTTEEQGLPLFDLLHLLVHERKQERAITAGAAWRSFLDGRELRRGETEALARYCTATGLTKDVADAITRLYPALVAHVAEANWDYSRPRWLQRQFGL